MGSRRPISAILVVFGGLEIGLRCAGYAGWVCIRSIYDLRRAEIAQAPQACYGLEASADFQTSTTKQDFAGDNVSEGGGDHDDKKRVGACSSPAAAHVPFPFQQKRRESQREAARRSRKKKKEEVAHMQDRLPLTALLPASGSSVVAINALSASDAHSTPSGVGFGRLWATSAIMMRPRN